MPNDLDVMLKVTLDKSTNPWSLDVDQHGDPNHVNQGPNPQRIVWTLMGDASSGSFVALDANEPGFAWFGEQPADGIFDGLSISPNSSKQLTVTDYHLSAASSGTWIYTLRAQIGGTVYATIAISPTGENTNPSIKNN